MSSGRRGGNEESILAMLERDGGRGSGLPPSRLALYGAGAAVAVGLVAALVWLARDQGASDLVVAAEAPVAIVAEAAPPRPAPHAAEVVPQQPTPQAAIIVDEPQPPAKTASQEVPPLVLLTPSQATEHASAAHASAPALAETHPAEKAPAGTDVRAAAAGTAPKARPIATAAAHAEPRRVAKTVTGSRQESARPRSPAKPAAAPNRVASHHAAVRPAPKQKKTAVTPEPTQKVDSDVALISAVIQHASNRANAAGGDCGGEANCAAKATPVE
jgi:hypothetical protein